MMKLLWTALNKNFTKDVANMNNKQERTGQQEWPKEKSVNRADSLEGIK